MTKSCKKCLLIFVSVLLLSITVGYPALYITDEWISADQLNHIIEGRDLLYGYTPYGASDYAASPHAPLCYTLALPAVSSSGPPSSSPCSS